MNFSEQRFAKQIVHRKPKFPMKFNQISFSKKLNQKRMMKGDVWYVSTFFFLVSLFFVTMIMLFSMSIARLIVGNLIDYTVHVSFLDFSLNTENSLVSAMEIKLTPANPQLKRILSNAAFQWDGGGVSCGDPPQCWSGNVYVDGGSYDASQISKDILDKLVQGPYSFELRKKFGVDLTKSVIMASRDRDKIIVDPEIAEEEFYLPYAACAGCDKIAVYRLYSTVK